jgi:hypothetical protein
MKRKQVRETYFLERREEEINLDIEKKPGSKEDLLAKEHRESQIRIRKASKRHSRSRECKGRGDKSEYRKEASKGHLLPKEHRGTS